jgi:aromatic-L-amino-acid decarboxylase
MVIRSFGVEGLRERIREHCAMARGLADRIEADPRFELAAPVPFSAVCFRARSASTLPEEQDRFNERLMARINAAGPVLLSHTVLQGRYTLRAAIGNLRTEPEHVEALWKLIVKSFEELA